MAIPTPGHTAGHTVLLYAERFLFTGDHLDFDRHEQHLSASFDYCWHSWPRQVESVEKLLAYDFQWVLPGHGQRVRLPRDTMRRQLSELVQRMWYCLHPAAAAAERLEGISPLAGELQSGACPSSAGIESRRIAGPCSPMSIRLMNCTARQLFIAFNAALLLALVARVEAAELRAGVARADITDHAAGPVHDPCYVKVLAQKNDDATVVLITIDAVAIGEIGLIRSYFRSACALN